MSWARLEDFGKGLNLASGPLDPAYSIDCQDVLYGRSIRSRPGYAPFVTSASLNIEKMHPWRDTNGATYLIAGSGGTTKAYDTAGAPLASTISRALSDAVSFGSPGSEAAYLAEGPSGNNPVFKFSGTTFSTPSGMPRARWLTVQSADNRLVATGFLGGAYGPGGATVNPSTVYFSDEGAPETWTTNNYVHLTPGDGEKIQGCESWRNMVFVFKESKFFVFYGNSEGADGTPVFNFRQVDGAGLVAPHAIAKAPEGIYFLAKDGIYFTNGGNPERVLEQEMGPIFGTQKPKYLSHGLINQETLYQASAVHYQGRTYFSVPMNGSNANNRIIVLDRAFGWWSIYTIPAFSMAVWSVEDGVDELFLGPWLTEGIRRHSALHTTDAGDAIPAFSRQAWMDTGKQQSCRQVKLWGRGTVSTRVSTDYNYHSGPSVVTQFGSDEELWGDGSTGAPWGEGESDDWLWGGIGTGYHRTVRGLAARGWLFSITFTNESADPMVIEQASMNLLGGRNGE